MWKPRSRPAQRHLLLRLQKQPATPILKMYACCALRQHSIHSLIKRCAGCFWSLNTNDVEQAVERASTSKMNKGYDAAMVAIEMANLLPQL